MLDRNLILTFHDLHDDSDPLTQIIDKGTVEQLSCDEYYSQSQHELLIFKHLLRNCFQTKLYKKNIIWLKKEGLYVFYPIQKDKSGQWISRQIQWIKTSKNVKRTVVFRKMNLKDENSVYSLKCLAFKSNFEYFDNEWFISIKPDWIFLWNNLTVCPFEYKSIQWLKRAERNMHVFNHFNFILKYLQPTESSLFTEYEDYKYLTISDIEKFEFAPIIPDIDLTNLEEQDYLDKMKDNEGDIGLFGL